MKRIVRIILKVFLFLFGALLLIVFIYLFPWLWRGWVTYPELEKERAEIRSQYKKPKSRIEKIACKGIIHMHSYWSHDSRGAITEILPAAKQAGMNFLFFSDHARHKLDTFPRSLAGMYDGILFEPGTETSQGLIVNPMDSVVIDWNKPQGEIIKQVVDNGGLAYYCHTEKPHEWDNPDYQAMEIYNIHTDFLDDERSILPFVLNFALNGRKYGHWAMREIFDEQTEIMARWDELNRERRITGVGAADAHNNQNVRARYNKAGMVEWIGPNADLLATVKPGWKEKLLLSDEPDEAGWSFRFETDSYFNSFNFINTHVFCDTLERENIAQNIAAGHAFIAFENLANARGFEYYSENEYGKVNAIVGDSILSAETHQLKVISPFPAYFKLVKDGDLLEFREEADYSFAFDPKNLPGNYRVEAYFKIDGKLLQWVLTNPIYLHE